MRAQIVEPLHHQQPLWRTSGCQFLVLENPGIAVRHENGMQSRRQRRIDVGLRTVPDHPSAFGLQRVFGDC